MTQLAGLFTSTSITRETGIASALESTNQIVAVLITCTRAWGAFVHIWKKICTVCASGSKYVRVSMGLIDAHTKWRAALHYYQSHSSFLCSPSYKYSGKCQACCCIGRFCTSGQSCIRQYLNNTFTSFVLPICSLSLAWKFVQIRITLLHIYYWACAYEAKCIEQHYGVALHVIVLLI